ncbi:MAG: FAD-dependent oxidoreductase [Saprospiraceae bacterium]|nr:FAD-dependent oxidoreductase [Saprospiraceae bacterium]
MHRIQRKGTATIIGSGIQGCTIALQLVRRGYHVNLIEKNSRLYSQASVQQEGKIHLGFIYAMDTLTQTSERLLSDALHFSPILDELIGMKIDWSRLKSTRFNYLIAVDSMMEQEKLLQHYHDLNDKYHSLIKDPKLHYLGERPGSLIDESSARKFRYNANKIRRVIPVVEHSIYPEDLRMIIIRKVRDTPINILTGHNVTAVRRTSFGFETICRSDAGDVAIPSDMVINAAWDGKRKIDRTMGLEDTDIWSLRIKMGLIFDNFHPKLDSFSMVQGSYGDLVIYPVQRQMYMSWYSHCLLQQTSEDELDQEGKALCASEIRMSTVETEIEQTIQCFQEILNIKDLSDPNRVKAGAILARGHQSITKPESQLHRRNDPPIESHDGYFSVNTGKFTSAPLNSWKFLAQLEK